MTLRPVTYYEVVCDHEGCEMRTSGLGGDYTAWSSDGDAQEDWEYADGQTVGDRHYCEVHRVPECCECDATDSLVEHDDGDHYCPTHIPTVRSAP